MKINELRTGNLVQDSKGNICRVESIDSNETKIVAWRADGSPWGTHEPKPLPLIREWFEKLGFEVTELADHWEFKKDDFLLLQLKLEIIKEMPPFYILHSKISQHIKVPHVHRLQNLYYEIKNQELIYKP